MLNTETSCGMSVILTFLAEPRPTAPDDDADNQHDDGDAMPRTVGDPTCEQHNERHDHGERPCRWRRPWLPLRAVFESSSKNADR